MPKSALLDSFCVSPSRPTQSDDANIVFVHGSPATKSRKGKKTSTRYAKFGARLFVLLEFLSSRVLVFLSSEYVHCSSHNRKIKAANHCRSRLRLIACPSRLGGPEAD